MLDFLSDDGYSVPCKISKQTKLPKELYSDLETQGWQSSPRLLQTWRGFLSLTGNIMCVYSDCQFRADNIDSIKDHLDVCECIKEHNTVRKLFYTPVFKDRPVWYILYHTFLD